MVTLVSIIIVNYFFKAFFFLEYENEQSMVEAISAMNFFDLAGQHLRVGRAITPPNCFEATVQSPTPVPAVASLPTAAAIAAAAATAKIQAMDAAATSNGSPSGSTPGNYSFQPGMPVLASSAPGVITGVTIINNSPNGSVVIPPPTMVTTLPPLSLKSTNGTNGKASEIVTNHNNFADNSIVKSLIEQQQVQEDGQTLQQQENVVIKGSNARQVLMHKLMRKNEVCVSYIVKILLI